MNYPICVLVMSTSIQKLTPDIETATINTIFWLSKEMENQLCRQLKGFLQHTVREDLPVARSISISSLLLPLLLLLSVLQHDYEDTDKNSGKISEKR